ncbi:hypothetical protein BT96DRAFT_1020704 [Gymnopus androsaceus JB14]|uniref:F-box domain-containing protein n=1 Tax=Gymnopus androsaceus JB14 TaxID=1447944 RepID=A0A6A4HIP3_9AGAR|nr:hypothetical protein BT96DRAFT_1020704 [Gymnopus androsaceus JB14]
MPFAPNFCSNELDSLTSDGPTPKVHELDALLHKVEIDKAGILSEISILENTVSDYKRRVQKLEDVYARKIRFHRSALSRFPKEILTIIFEELCIENSFASEETIYAMTLCRVCKLWKQIVENHGQCWSTFHIRGSCYYRKMKDEKERAKLQRLTKIFLAHAVTGTDNASASDNAHRLRNNPGIDDDAAAQGNP